MEGHEEMYTQTPSSLRHGEYEESDELLRQAMNRLKANQDIKTAIYVNFPLTLTGVAQEKMSAVMSNVHDWQCWTYGRSMSKVQEKINYGGLPAGSNLGDEAKRSTYKNKVIDFVVRSCTWLSTTDEGVQGVNIECSKLELQTTILKHVLKRFSVPDNTMGRLHEVLDSISQGILTVAKEDPTQSMQYLIMLTRYEYEPALERIVPVIRVINFQTNAVLNAYNLTKSWYHSNYSVSLRLEFYQYQCRFDDGLYTQIKSDLDQRMQEQGREFMAMTASEINIPVDAV